MSDGVRRGGLIGWAALVGYAATAWLANWSIGHWGVQFAPGGPHLLPLGFGLYAPSGVVWVAAALALRNLVQEKLGRGRSAAGILVGAALSAWLSPQLALASGGAFLVSETLDMVIWSRLRQSGVLIAQAASNVASDVVDSVCFLWLAFGSLSLLAGQVVGKEEVTALTVLLLVALRVGRYAPKHVLAEEVR